MIGWDVWNQIKQEVKRMAEDHHDMDFVEIPAATVSIFKVTRRQNQPPRKERSVTIRFDQRGWLDRVVEELKGQPFGVRGQTSFTIELWEGQIRFKDHHSGEETNLEKIAFGPLD